MGKRTRDCRRSLIDNSNTLILLTDLGMLFLREMWLMNDQFICRLILQPAENFCRNRTFDK